MSKRSSTAMMNSMVSRLSMPKESIGADRMSSSDIEARVVLSSPVVRRKISTHVVAVSSVMEIEPCEFRICECVVAASQPHLAEREAQRQRRHRLCEASPYD